MNYFDPDINYIGDPPPNYWPTAPDRNTQPWRTIPDRNTQPWRTLPYTPQPNVIPFNPPVPTPQPYIPQPTPEPIPEHFIDNPVDEDLSIRVVANELWFGNMKIVFQTTEKAEGVTPEFIGQLPIVAAKDCPRLGLEDDAVLIPLHQGERFAICLEGEDSYKHLLQIFLGIRNIISGETIHESDWDKNFFLVPGQNTIHGISSAEGVRQFEATLLGSGNSLVEQDGLDENIISTMTLRAANPLNHEPNKLSQTDILEFFRRAEERERSRENYFPGPRWHTTANPFQIRNACHGFEPPSYGAEDSLASLIDEEASIGVGCGGEINESFCYTDILPSDKQKDLKIYFVNAFAWNEITGLDYHLGSPREYPENPEADSFPDTSRLDSFRKNSE